MRRLRAMLATVAAAGLVAAVLDVAGPIVAADSAGARVTVNEVGLTWASLGQPATWAPAGPKRFTTFAATSGPQLLVLTDRSAYWVDQAGELRRSTRFPRRLSRVAAVRFRRGEDWTIVGATDDYGRQLLLLPADGSRPASVRTTGLQPVFADVLGDDELEIVSVARDELFVDDRRGHLLRRLTLPLYTDQVWPVDTDGSGWSELLTYHFQTRKKGTVLTLIDARGRQIAGWHEERSNRYSLCQWRSVTPEIIASRDDVLSVRSIRGERLKEYRVPGLGTFRQVRTSEFAGGHRVILPLAGACPSRLLVFGPDDRLLYDEQLDGPADVWPPGPDGHVFYVAIGDTIRSYTRPGTAR